MPCSKKIQKQDTVMRQAIPPGERLAVTLRFLASGNRFQDLQYLYRIPTCTISRIKTNYSKEYPDCFVSPLIKVSRDDIKRFKDIYSIDDYDNFPLMYWLAGIYKTIVELEINQANACVALSKDLLQLIGNANWEYTRDYFTLDPTLYLDKIIVCNHSMFCVNKMRDLTIINPMQSEDECVLVKCRYLNSVILGISSKERKWKRLISTVLDFDVNLVSKPTVILPREKMVLQMFQSEPWSDSVIQYFKNHHMVVDIAEHLYGFFTVLLNSEKELTVEQLCGDLSHCRNSYINVDGCHDGISIVHVPNIRLTPIYDCFYLDYKDQHPIEMHPEYEMIHYSQFECKEIHQILTWLIGLREMYRKHCLSSGDEAYVVITRDTLLEFESLFVFCSGARMMYFRQPKPGFYHEDNVIIDQYGKMFHKNEMFNQTRIDREGFQGVILNPLNYCPCGSTVCVMSLKDFYTTFRMCGSEYDYDFFLNRVIMGYSDMIVDTISVNKCIQMLTEWDNLFKDSLSEELRDATFKDVGEIKNIIRMRANSARRYV